MNESFEQENESQSCCCGQLQDYVRKNPAQVILAAAGVVLLVALCARPRKPEHRALQMLDDIQRRLKHAAEPVYNRALSAAEKGAAAFRDSKEHLDDIDIPSTFRDLRGKLKQIFR
jgi:hypothetical protein